MKRHPFSGYSAQKIEPQTGKLSVKEVCNVNDNLSRVNCVAHAAIWFEPDF
jgi:hypothetical protein